MITGVFPPRRGGPLAAHGNAVGLIRYKTLSPVWAPHDAATNWNGLRRLGCPFRAASFWGQFSHGVAMGWKRIAPYGALGLAEVRAGFRKNPERLTHGIPVANRPENLEMCYKGATR